MLEREQRNHTARHPQLLLPPGSLEPPPKTPWKRLWTLKTTSSTSPRPPPKNTRSNPSGRSDHRKWQGNNIQDPSGIVFLQTPLPSPSTGQPTNCLSHHCRRSRHLGYPLSVLPCRPYKTSWVCSARLQTTKTECLAAWQKLKKKTRCPLQETWPTGANSHKAPKDLCCIKERMPGC